jgi:hypothetical protein
MNRYFELHHEVEDKLPAIATSYIKNGSFYFSHHVAPPTAASLLHLSRRFFPSSDGLTCAF